MCHGTKFSGEREGEEELRVWAVVLLKVEGVEFFGLKDLCYADAPEDNFIP